MHLLLQITLACCLAVSSGCSVDYEGWNCNGDSDCVNVDKYICSSVTRTCAQRLGHGQMPCKTSHECLEGHVCDTLRSMCLLPNAQGRNPEDGPCEVDTDCEPSFGCHPEPQQGYLRCGRLSGVTGICRKDATDCTSPLQCEDNTCRAPVGTPCASAASCPLNTACRPDEAKLLRCLPKAPPGSPCLSTGDCARGQCSPAMARCPGEAGLSCVSESDCLAPNVCVPVGADRLCSPPVGSCQRCDTDSDCSSSTCRGSVCLSTLSGNCTMDACCPSPTLCIPDGGGSTKCKFIGTTPGAICLINSHCSNHMECWEGRECRYKINNGPCGGHSDCVGSPPVCLNRLCIEPGGEKAPCVEPDGTVVPSACKAGLLCGVVVCVKPSSLPEGDRCRTTLECQPSLSCVGGFCKR